MPDNTQQLSVSPESLERKHEVSEKRVRNVLIVAGGAMFVLFFGLMLSAGLIYNFSRYRKMQQMKPLGLIIAPNLKPLERFPRPDLQIDDDHAEMTKLYAGQNAELNSYGWIDRSHGIVRIPIDRAMELILQKGLPEETNRQTDGSTLQLIQKIPEQTSQ